jgi:sulfate permease, SulP family
MDGSFLVGAGSPSAAMASLTDAGVGRHHPTGMICPIHPPRVTTRRPTGPTMGAGRTGGDEDAAMSGRRGAGSGLARYLPALGWLGGYRRSWLRGDLVAGVTTAAVVIPQAMAYATIAGLPVQVGLYVATVPMVVYALAGTSRPLSVSTTSTLAALTAAAVATVGSGDPARALAAASTLAALAGALLLGAGLLRLGFMADFISAPVLAGFKAGTGLLIAAGQLGKILGVPQEGDSFLGKVASALSQLDHISWPTLTLAAVSIAILLGLRRWGPRSLPGPLLVVAFGILLAATTGLADRGVALVGAIPAGLPGFAAPDPALVGPLVGPAAGVALMAFVESIAAARAFTAPDEPEVDADQELRALGAANLAAGCFQAFPAGGGLSQTAVNRQSGARSQLAGITTALVVVLTLLFLTPLFEDLPQATLGAVVIVAVVGLVDLAALRRIHGLRFRDYALALVALGGVLALGVLGGVLLAVVVSMLTMIHGANHPPIEVLGRRPGGGQWRALDRHPDGQTIPGLLVLRPVASIYFANGPRLRARLLGLVDAADPHPRVLVLELGAVPDIDVTALDMVRRLPDADAFQGRLSRELDAAATAFGETTPFR